MNGLLIAFEGLDQSGKHCLKPGNALGIRLQRLFGINDRRDQERFDFVEFKAAACRDHNNVEGWNDQDALPATPNGKVGIFCDAPAVPVIIVLPSLSL
jgi:hypothetical protein